MKVSTGSTAHAKEAGILDEEHLLSLVSMLGTIRRNVAGQKVYCKDVQCTGETLVNAFVPLKPTQRLLSQRAFRISSVFCDVIVRKNVTY